MASVVKVAGKALAVGLGDVLLLCGILAAVLWTLSKAINFFGTNAAASGSPSVTAQVSQAADSVSGAAGSVNGAFQSVQDAANAVKGYFNPPPNPLPGGDVSQGQLVDLVTPVSDDPLGSLYKSIVFMLTGHVLPTAADTQASQSGTVAAAADDPMNFSGALPIDQLNGMGGVYD
jgi:hypothetical protein